MTSKNVPPVQAKILIDLGEFERLVKLEEKFDQSLKRNSDLEHQLGETSKKSKKEEEERAIQEKKKKEEPKNDLETRDSSQDQFGTGVTGAFNSVETAEAPLGTQSEARPTEEGSDESNPRDKSEPRDESESKNESESKGGDNPIGKEEIKLKGTDQVVAVQTRYKEECQELLANLESRSGTIDWDSTGKISLWGKETNLFIKSMLPYTFYPTRVKEEDSAEISLWVTALVDANCGQLIKNKSLLFKNDWFYLGE